MEILLGMFLAMPLTTMVKTLARWRFLMILMERLSIFFFARKVLEWGADKPVIGRFFSWCLKKGHKGGEKLKAKAGKNGLFIALLLFVGIPLPGTGAWTGTLAASILDMDFKTSVLAVMLGVILAGVIIGTLSYLGFGVWFGLT